MAYVYVLNTIIHQEKATNRGKYVFYESLLLLDKRKNSMDVNEKCIIVRHKNCKFHFESFLGFVCKA